ncbi:helix-turn-helix domain-containing protein [Paenisporosarcina cavernae]|uniref:DNA-binding protein n=1 Tax=Paenisporosarcina cavernae TaxID=2320858 RepID=A0A385YT11_9BACL|nr:helix-turn-helix domain-containing protein [Paenisporosarcina cavernae]AYC29674.1 DNA-binding protein [Paenisporosarcina cavernae]
MHQLLDVTEVAKILKVNRNKVYDLIKHGHLRALKLGRLKVSTIELEDFMIRNSGKDLSDFENVKELEVV